MPVVMPVVVFFLVAHQSRFYGERLVAKSSEAEAGARTSEALLRVARALTTATTSGSLLQQVTELAREVMGSTWGCVIVRNPRNGKYRVGGLASRTGKLDEEIKSVEFRAAGFDDALARLPLDGCLAVRSAAESPFGVLLRTRWNIGPFLAAALRRGDEAVGLLLIGQDDPATAFQPTGERLLAGIAHQTVLALDNARLVDELRAASSLKSEFIGTMSHELRSPLNAIIGYTDLLRDEAQEAVDDPGAAARDDTLNRVRFYALQLLEMIQATLDVSRLEAGRLPLHETRVELAPFVADLQAGIPEYWEKPDVALQWSVPPELPAVVLDGPKIVTIVRNLVHNALKFTERGAIDVHVRLEPQASAGGSDADRLVFVVADTGIGIPKEQLGVVFEMFRQVDGSNTRRHGGVGLGLYIVTRLTQALGGTVNVESIPGAGSTFTVSVPVRMAGVEERAREAS
jgi:signal transduction histidine kinase